MNFSVIGGDRRYLTVAESLADLGCVRVFGVDGAVGRSGVALCGNIRAALCGADAVILPIPAVAGDGCINTFSEQRITASDLAELLPRGALVVGGMLGEEFTELMRSRGIRSVDCCSDGQFTYENAYISAEGALTAVMGKTGRAIRGDSFGIVGYGRIGRQLAALLAALGAEVRVSARSAGALESSAADGFAVFPMEQTDGTYRVPDGFFVGLSAVFNTVPARVIRLGAGKLPALIELASLPGGFDPVAARQAGVSVQVMRGIPGRYAPESAGRAIAGCVCRILGSEGVPL